MNFLNEVSQRFPDAISFAAGRPFEGLFDTELVHRYLRRYTDHLMERFDDDVALVRRTVLQYGRTKGIIHDLIARNLAVDENVVVDPESIVVTVGCQEALFLTLRALRRTEKDCLLTVLPCYVGVAGAAELVDMPLLPVKGSPEGIDLADLVAVVKRARESGLRPRALYVVADFANPSGISLDLETREQLLRLAEEHDFLLLEDNPYGIFHAPDADPLPTLKALDRDRRVIHLGSFAKTGLPGARIGYAIADQLVSDGNGGTQSLADQLAKIKSMLTVNTSPIAQAVIGGKLLEHDFSLRAANARENAVYQENLRHLLAGLAERFPPDQRSGVTWNVPTGGFFVVLDVPFPVDDELLELSARRHRVLWTPMHHFYGDGEPRHQIRLSFSYLTVDQIAVGLDRLAEFIHDQRERKSGTAPCRGGQL
ncbi:aminotransferase-like domain-containing protein [Kitasatospora cathayae]|uniref:PLP-dependent aminotransferase family protein n=1 Tax=Kitasatospora cathayae TaxID=3004092 RepID=A0ABY7QG43_9ACTN|nr:PLP-dependent aminotransferase family protein [Kitasatospora sp. HUAS 3-15]WBP91541.1 PLP-dependent aminotransferase family protein [Kitasatospora sp. HUAS 3-15]